MYAHLVVVSISVYPYSTSNLFSSRLSLTMPHRRFRSRRVRMEADMANLRPEADMANLSRLLHDALREARLPPSLAGILTQGNA